MIEALPGATFTAITPDGFATGLAGTIGVRVERSDGSTFTARTTIGIVELEAGAGVYTKTNLVAPTVAGVYVVLWDDGAGNFKSEELRIAYSTSSPGGFTPATYATTADLEAYVEGFVDEDPAATARLLERATRDVDNVLGPIAPLSSGDYHGLKLDPTTLTEWEAGALARATCAQADWRRRRGEEELAVGRTAKRIKGPDFEEEYADSGAAGPSGTGTGRYSPQVRLELEPIRHLRRLTAYVSSC